MGKRTFNKLDIYNCRSTIDRLNGRSARWTGKRKTRSLGLSHTFNSSTTYLHPYVGCKATSRCTWSNTYLKLLEIAGFSSRRLFSNGGLLDHLCYRVSLFLLPPHNPHVSGAILMQRNRQFKVVFKLLFRQVLHKRFTNCGSVRFKTGEGIGEDTYLISLYSSYRWEWVGYPFWRVLVLKVSFSFPASITDLFSSVV